MTERDVPTEVIKGLQEVREHRAGKRKLRETLVESAPLPEPDLKMIERIRGNLEDSEEVVSQASCNIRGSRGRC